jgi:hypothetical protein
VQLTSRDVNRVFDDIKGILIISALEMFMILLREVSK